MNRIPTFLKVTGWGALAIVAALLTWANWEPKPLHAYAKPVSMSIFKAEELQTAPVAAAFSQQLEKVPGVTACSANPESQLVAVTYHTDQLTEADLKRFIEQRFKVSKPSFESDEPAGPQCPVPAEYILALEQFKYALCFR